MYNCVIDGAKRECDATAADVYATLYAISRQRELAAINCTLRNNLLDYFLLNTSSSVLLVSTSYRRQVPSTSPVKYRTLSRSR